MSSANSIIKRIFIGFFALLLLMPAIQMSFGIVGESPVQEYRIFAPFPSKVEFFPPKLYKKSRNAFDSWFNDHVGFRNTLLRIGGQVSFSIFREASLVYVGQQDWLFMKIFYSNAYNASVNPLSASMVATFQRWAKLNDWLAKRGIHLIVVDVPMKHFIYPEFLPSIAPPMPKLAIWDQFRSFLDEHGIDRLDVKAILLDAKSRAQVYRKTDIHWSIYGACEVAEKLVDKIGKLETGDLRTWQIKYHYKQGALTNSGTESRALPLLKDATERYDLVEPDGLANVTPLNRDLTPDNPYDRIFESEGKRLLPLTVSLNDSFFENLEHCGLGQHFTRLYTGRTINGLAVTGINRVLRSIPQGTKYFIMEMMDQQLDYVLPAETDFPN